MTGRDARLALQAQAQLQRAEAEALAEVQAAAEAMRDAESLRDQTLLRMQARRAARVDPALLPPRWAGWVCELREQLGITQ